MVGAVNEEINELRIVENAPLTVASGGKLGYINKFGKVTGVMIDCPVVSKSEVTQIYNTMIESTKYDQSGISARGCIMLDNGLRVGVAGHKTNDLLCDINALVVRFCREYKGCSEKIVELFEANGICSVLIISKPSMGKTTVLRDLLQKMSERKIKCCAVDTTCELSGAGISLGRNTIVLKGYEKSEGALAAVKYLSPEAIVFDEITSRKDVQAVKYCATMGVPLIATCHARSEQELLRRDDISECIQKNMFEYIAVIGNNVGNIESIMAAEDLCTN